MWIRSELLFKLVELLLCPHCVVLLEIITLIFWDTDLLHDTNSEYYYNQNNIVNYVEVNDDI